MSMSTEAIDIIDNLQKDGINRETAKELIDFVEKQRGDLVTRQDIKDMATKQDVREAVRPIWIVMMAGFTALLSGLLTVMLYLHGNTNERLDRIEQRIESRLEKIEQLLQRGR